MAGRSSKLIVRTVNQNEGIKRRRRRRRRRFMLEGLNE